MQKNECKYFIYISADGNAKPVRVREEDKHVQLFNLLDGEPEITVPGKEGKYILVVDGDSSSLTNVPASILLGERGRQVRGAAVFCMISDDGEYLGFPKIVAQGMCVVINMLG